jgi:excisionase family DNA binding protein
MMMNNDNLLSDVKAVVSKAIDDNNRKYTWMGVDEACYYAKCSRTTLFKAVRDENLKSAKPIGVNSLKFRRDWLDRWLNG